MTPQLPTEILILLGSFLDRHSHTICIRVNTTWSLAFLPLIWKSASFSSTPPRTPSTRRSLHHPALEALQRHAHLVKCLALHGKLSKDISQLCLPSLMNLFVYIPRKTNNDERWDEESVLVLDNLLRAHFGTLEQVNVSEKVPQFQAAELPTRLWMALSDLPGWKKMVLSRVAIQQDHQGYLWRACQQTRELHLVNSPSLPGKILLPVKGRRACFFPKMTVLVLDHLGRVSVEDQFLIVGHCPALRTLSWHMKFSKGNARLVLTQFAQRAEEGCWRDLEELELDGFLSDEDLSRVIRSMVGVKVFQVPDSEFGSLAFSALVPHFSTLEKFESVRISNNCLTGAMVQEMMASCPRLKMLRVGRVEGSAVVEGEPWVCTELTVLQVFFEMPGAKDVQIKVFERLAKLKKLTRLVAHRPEHGQYEVQQRHQTQQGLDFRLEVGLGLLCTLKNLYSLDMQGLGQRIGMVEVEWMVEHWKRLKYFCGSIIPPEGELESDVVQVLKEGGVMVMKDSGVY